MAQPRAPRLVWLLVPILMFAAAACGDDSDSATASVASLADPATDSDEDPGETEVSAEDAALAFGECLRSEGIDVPDIGVDADGNLDLRATFVDSGVEIRSEEFRSAQETCLPLIEGIAFGGPGGRAGLADNAELEDAFLEFSDCIRDEGFDVGDLTLARPGSDDGGPPADDGEPPTRGEGQGRGDFGDPSARFGDLLGLDTEDPAVAAALELCNPIITDAFSATGAGRGNDE